MDTQLINDIRAQQEKPLIGVIGSTRPTRDYKREFGMNAGYKLRDYAGQYGGSVFTGGVNGVGVDVYAGVIKYCIDKLLEKRLSLSRSMADDKFFVLVPEYEEFLNVSISRLRRNFPYEIPEAYQVLGALSPRGAVDVVRAGNNMSERREYLSEVADMLVVVNGGGGTLDEALKALKSSKGVVAMERSGGAASILGGIKRNDIPRVIHLDKDDFIDFREVDTSLIETASNDEEMIRYVDRVLRA